MKASSIKFLWSIFLSAWVLSSSAQAEGFTPMTNRSYPGVVTVLRELESRFPRNASRFVLGKSDSGALIEGLKIGQGVSKSLIVATHHGNEYGSTEVALAAATQFAESPISGYTVYIVPVLNISGYNSRRREEKARGGSYDPNRDYPGPCGSDSEFALQSTRALASFLESEGVVNLATLHTHYPAVVYPWGFTTRDLVTDHQREFELLSEAAVQVSRYPIGNSSQVIYPANGTFEDYAFWKSGVWSLLFELGYTHFPSLKQIEEMIRVNVPGLRAMIEKAPQARAARHQFTGKCDDSLRVLDRRDE